MLMLMDLGMLQLSLWFMYVHHATIVHIRIYNCVKMSIRKLEVNQTLITIKRIFTLHHNQTHQHFPLVLVLTLVKVLPLVLLCGPK